MVAPYRYLSLFSGIGGFEVAAQIANQEIGFEAFEPAALCEVDTFCQRVLNRRFVNTPLIPDVKTISVEFIRELGRIDGIVGGFPCQEISNSGKRAGLAGERSGLFYEVIRLVRLVRPRFVYLENVAALLGRGMHEVLGEFAALRYDAEWSVIPCSTLGGSHRRERVWIIAANPGQDWRESQCCSRQLERKEQNASGSSSGFPSERRDRVFDWQRATESLVRRCHDGLPSGLANDAYLLRSVDISDWLPYAADSLPIAYRKEALQALGNAIVPQVGAIGFLKIYAMLSAVDCQGEYTAWINRLS